MASQFREAPPAYQEYPSDWLANHKFRGMSFGERGLLYTLRLECWVSKTIPADITKLSKVLGYTQSELELNLTESVLFFMVKKSNEFHFPDLEKYRIEMINRRVKSQKNAEDTNNKIKAKQAKQSLKDLETNDSKSVTLDVANNDSNNDTLSDTLLSREEKSGKERRGGEMSRPYHGSEYITQGNSVEKVAETYKDLDNDNYSDFSNDENPFD